MITYTYDFEILTMSTVFLNAMSDIVVKRFNDVREAKDQIKARVVYAPKQRVLNDLLDKDQNIQLPVVAITIGGIARDETRVFNKLQGNYFRSNDSTDNLKYDPTPVPIDVTFNVSILTRFQQDMDQILSHLIPYINPYFVVSWRTPQRPDFEIRSNVVWNGQANVLYPVDITSTVVARVTAELSFTFKGWLFRNVDTSDTIFRTDTALISRDNPFIYESRLTSLQGEYSNFIYEAVPAKPKLVFPYAATVNKPKRFSVWGTGFEKTLNVYLSGAPLQTIQQQQNPFAGSDLQTAYPEFQGIKLSMDSWSVTSSENLLEFTLPNIPAPGYIDVIIQNPYSYGNLKKFAPSNPDLPFNNGILISENTVLT